MLETSKRAKPAEMFLTFVLANLTYFIPIPKVVKFIIQLPQHM